MRSDSHCSNVSVSGDIGKNRKHLTIRDTVQKSCQFLISGWYLLAVEIEKAVCRQQV